MKKLSKILVALLTLAMLLGVIVISATATEAETGTVIEAPTQAALDEAVVAANAAGEEAGTVTIKITGDYSIKTRIHITRTTGKVVLDLNGHQLATSGFTGGDGSLLSLDLDTSGNPLTTDPIAAQFRAPVIYLGAGADLEVYGNGGTFVSATNIQNTLFAIPADAVGAKLHVADMVISKHLSNGGSLSSNSYRKNAFAVVFNGEFSMDNVKLDTAWTYGYVFRQAGNAEITVKNSTITQYMVAGSGLLHTGSTSTSGYTPENGYHIEFENCTIVTSELIHSAQRDKYAYGDNLVSNSITAYSSVDTRDVTKDAGYYTNVKALFKNCNVENLNYSNENAIAYFMQGGYANVDFKKSNVLIAHKGFYFSKSNGDVNNPCVVNFYDSYLELTGKGKIYYTHASNSESSPNCQVAVKLESGSIHYYATEIRMGSLFQRDASGNVIQPNGIVFAYTSFGFGALHDGCIVDSFLGSNQYWGPGKTTRYSGLTRFVLENGDCYYTTAADASAAAYRNSGATATVSWTATTSGTFGSSTSSTYYIDSTAANASSTSTVTYYGTDRALANGYGATVTLLQNAVKVELSVPTTINKNGKELFYYSENCTTSTDGDIVTVALAPADAAKYTVTVDYDDGEAPETVTYVEGSYFWYNLDRLPAELGGFDSETGKVTSLTLNGAVVESLDGFSAPVLLAGSKTEAFALEATKEYGWVILTPEGNFVDGFENYATSDDIGETWAELVARVNEIEKYLNPMDESDTTPDIVDGMVADKFFVGCVHTKMGYTIKLYKDFLNTESDPVSTLNFRNNIAYQLTNDGRTARNRPIVIDLNGHTVVTPEMLFYSYSDLIVWYYDADGFVTGVKGVDYSKEIVGANQTQNFTAGTIEGDGITGVQVCYASGSRTHVTVASKVEGARIIATSETEPVAQANATGNSAAYANIGAAASTGYARLRIDAPMLIKTTVYSCYTNVVNVEAHLSGATPIRSEGGWATIDNAQLFYEGYQTEGFIRVGGRQIYLRNATIISDSKVNLFASSVVESNSAATTAYVETSNIFNLYIDSQLPFLLLLVSCCGILIWILS